MPVIKFCEECKNVFTADACYCSEHDSEWLIEGSGRFCNGSLYTFTGSDEEVDKFIEKIIRG